MNLSKQKYKHNSQKNRSYYPNQRLNSTTNKRYNYQAGTKQNLQHAARSTKFQSSYQQMNKNQERQNQQKENKIIYKDMQKCNEKMEYYKLMGSLQQQKRNILQQQNSYLKQENMQLKDEIDELQKQNDKLVKRLNKMGNQVLEKRRKETGSQKDYVVQISEKVKGRKKRSKQKVLANQSQKERKEGCQKCIQLFQKLQSQRQLYQKDRKYLKQQIQNLNQVLQENERKEKLEKMQKQNQNRERKRSDEKNSKERNSFKGQEKKELSSLLQSYALNEQTLKQQLTACYNQLEQKCKLITQLQIKIDYFEQENKRVLKFITLLNKQQRLGIKKYQKQGINKQNNIQPKILFVPQQPIKPHQNRKYFQNQQVKNNKQQRSNSSYAIKSKNFNYSQFYNDNQIQSSKNLENTIANRRNKRKFGSIKKIQFNQ